ncbi:MAG: YlxR family protein [Fimbriimonadaceae bacterium]
MVCRQRKPQGELLRLARSQDGSVVLGKGGGRGAYCCRVGECVAQVADARRLQRAWRVKVTQAELEGLGKEVQECQR